MESTEFQDVLTGSCGIGWINVPIEHKRVGFSQEIYLAGFVKARIAAWQIAIPPLSIRDKSLMALLIDPLLNTKEVARILGVRPNTLWK